MEYPSNNSRLRSFRISFACWSAFCVILGLQLLIADRAQNNFLPLFHYFIWPALLCYPWAILTPAVLDFARHYPFTQANWLSQIGRYLMATVVFLSAEAVLQGTGSWLYIGLNVAGIHIENLQARPLNELIIEALLLKDLLLNLNICIVLYLLAAYLNAQRQIRYRQLHEAHLEARVASAELEMLRIQLHPHFLFNTLQAATVLVHEDPNAAEDILLRLSDLLRVTLDEMSNQEVTLQRELDFLDLYLGIQRQRFKDRLRVHVAADSAILNRKVPSLILQPLVENAVHHGIGRHKEDDSVEVSAHANNGFLELEVRNYASSLNDNVSPNGHGVGLRNIRARLEQLYGDAATLELRPIQPRGVSALVKIPSPHAEPAPARSPEPVRNPAQK
jgi:sensor histidine kinase YesM